MTSVYNTEYGAVLREKVERVEREHSRNKSYSPRKTLRAGIPMPTRSNTSTPQRHRPFSHASSVQSSPSKSPLKRSAMNIDNDPDGSPKKKRSKLALESVSNSPNLSPTVRRGSRGDVEDAESNLIDRVATRLTDASIRDSPTKKQASAPSASPSPPNRRARHALLPSLDDQGHDAPDRTRGSVTLEKSTLRKRPATTDVDVDLPSTFRREDKEDLDEDGETPRCGKLRELFLDRHPWQQLSGELERVFRAFKASQ